MQRSIAGMTVLTAVLAAATATLHAHAEGLQAGLWRSVQTPALNGIAGPPRETMRCLRDAEVADLERTFSPVYGTTNSACEQVEREFTPQRLKWRLQCRGQLDMDVAGEFVFERPDRYTATIVASSSMLGKLMQETHTRIEAERVGECK
jgi:Protein of unknown function (DUF3617)